MFFDIFFSISQTKVADYLPSEQTLYKNFLDQAKLADDLGFGTAWIAESHLSSEVQKLNPNPVIPHFEGEVGINVDFFQTATRVFMNTKRINCGSAIMNILCNGGPIAAAERVRSFLAFHQLEENESRKIEIGFASGRFPYINHPYGIVPRNEIEKSAWGPVMVNKIFKEAAEIFIRLIKGEILSSDMITEPYLERSDFKTDEAWEKVQKAANTESEKILLERHYHFNKLQIVPKEANIEKHLNLVIGSHDPRVQAFVNTLHPIGVFNLSITSNDIVDRTNTMMTEAYHKSGGTWSRDKMPRTVLVFINNDSNLSSEEQNEKAKETANFTLSEYWKALEGTLDPEKVKRASNNALIGNPETIRKQIRERYHPEDRLMLWFDFHNHDNNQVKKNMENFMTHVAPEFK